MNHLVSVIIPSFNSDQTLRETVESVLAQTHQNLECIVIDDGSSDQSFDLAMAIATEDSRVKVLVHPEHANLGVSVSRNRGLDHSSGRFIAFLDADDAWLPQKLERQLSVFSQRPEIGFVFCDTYICTDPDPSRPMSEQSLVRDGFRSKNDKLFTGETNRAIESMLFHPSPFRLIPSPTPIVRAELFAEGLRFAGPPKLSLQYEDFLMWKCLAVRTPILALHEPLSIYRVHSSSFTGCFQKKNDVLGHLKCLTEVDELFLSSLPRSFVDLNLTAQLKRRLDKHFILAVQKLPVSHLWSLWICGIQRGIKCSLIQVFIERILSAAKHYISRILVRTRLTQLLDRSRRS